MITFEDVLNNHPTVVRFEEARVEEFVQLANIGLPDSRFGGDDALADRGRILWVMHMMEKPPADLQAPHVLAQMSNPKPFGKKPHPWGSTEHGAALIDLATT